MAKEKTTFTCTECGGTSPRWLGKCPECEQWNSFVEEQEAAPAASGMTARRRPLTDFSSEVATLDQIVVSPLSRTASGIPEFDRVVGGGVDAHDTPPWWMPPESPTKSCDRIGATALSDCEETPTPALMRPV